VQMKKYPIQIDKNPKLTASSPNHLLYQDNVRMHHLLNELLDSAKHNQQTQDRFHQLEMFLLESESFEVLVGRILNELKRRLRLSQVELYILDINGDIRQLLQEIYGALDYPNYYYANTVTEIKNHYDSSIRLTLTQDKELINKAFSGHAGQSKSAVLLPLSRGVRLIGSLHIGSRDKERFHPDLASNFLQHLGSIITVCIENSINQERFKHLSLVDILTRAKNRRYFFQIIESEIARAKRTMQPLSCLFIDVDHFKKINDTMGHQTGDLTLKALVKNIQPLLRQTDILSRFGGEEFTILLPNTNTREAYETAERIRSHIAETIMYDTEDNPFSITLSIGLSCWQPDKQDFESDEAVQNYLIHQADEAVYQAKENGRNQTCPKL